MERDAGKIADGHFLGDGFHDGMGPWEQVKRDGIDYIALYYVNAEEKRVQILDAELA